MDALSLGSGSQVFIAVSSAIAKLWAFKTTSTGAFLFPNMTVNGGAIGGCTVFVTEG